MLIDKHNRDILPLARELVKGALDGGVLGFGVDDEVVLLRVRRVRDVLARSLMSVSFSLFVLVW